MKLREVFRRAKARTLPREWLYLPAAGEWNLDTEGTFIDCELEELDEKGIPPRAKLLNLCETLDDTLIEDAVIWADRLAGGENDEARLKVFRYYVRFDAFPETLGAPDPPPYEETRRRLDQEYYDSLGAENTDTKCRHGDCNRGTTKFSVFCRKHQFEQVKKRPCPFE